MRATRWLTMLAVPLLVLAIAAPPAGASTGPYDDAVLADSPNAFFRLDHATGDAVDETGNVATGTVSVCGTCVNRKGALRSEPANKAVLFDGASIIFFTAHPLPLQPSPSWAIEAWVSMKKVSAAMQYVYGTGDDFSGESIGVVNGQFVGTVNLGGDPQHVKITTPAAYADGRFHQVVFVRNATAGTLALFVDGVRVVVQNVGTAATHYDPFSTSLWSIGAWESGFDTSNYFKGTIDEVSVYPVALTKTRIRAHRAASR